MNKHKLDAEKTRAKLASAMKVKLSRKNFSKITISELTETCGMNRKTFYYHFRSTDDLLAWMIERETVEVIKKIDLLKNYDQAIDFILDYIEKNRKMLCAINNSVGRGEVHKFLQRNIKPSVEGLLGKINGADALEPDFRDFVIEFYTEAIVGTLESWLEKDIPREKDILTRYTARLLKDAQKMLS